MGKFGISELDRCVRGLADAKIACYLTQGKTKTIIKTISTNQQQFYPIASKCVSVKILRGPKINYNLI